MNEIDFDDYMDKKDSLGHYCGFCECYHSSSSCFHPGRKRYNKLYKDFYDLEDKYNKSLDKINVLLAENEDLKNKMRELGINA
jgi:hypothetical protein